MAVSLRELAIRILRSATTFLSAPMNLVGTVSHIACTRVQNGNSNIPYFSHLRVELARKCVIYKLSALPQ